MTNLGDPQTYIGIATGTITVATGAVTAAASWAKFRADRAYLDRVEELCVRRSIERRLMRMPALVSDSSGSNRAVSSTS